MVRFPQFFLLWCLRCRREEKQAIALICVSAARPWRATPGTTAQQVMWRSDTLSPPLDGSYCLWEVDSCVGLERPRTLANEIFVGTPGLVNRIRGVDEARQFDLAGGGNVHCRSGQQSIALLRVPQAVAQVLLEDAAWLVTPASYAIHCQVDLQPGDADVEDDAEDEACLRPQQMSLEAWRSRGAGWKEVMGREHISPAFEIECARLAMRLNCLDDVDSVCRLAARILCPEKDISKLVFPSAETVRLSIIKIDMMHMLFTRRLFTQPVRVARYIMPDSSPQGKYDYFCCKEEVMIRPANASVERENFSPWGGFEWQRRSMVPTTIGRGEGNVATKLSRIAHSAVLEAGEKHLYDWRIQTKGFLSDQGTERGIRAAPFGDKDEISEVMSAVKEHRLPSFDPRAVKVVFLMFALQQSGLMHVYYNALEEAIAKVECWKEYLTLLAAFVKILGDASYKERLLEKSFAAAPASTRRLLHAFAGTIVDWRWEHLEELLEQVIDLIEPMRTYFRPEDAPSGDASPPHQ